MQLVCAARANEDMASRGHYGSSKLLLTILVFFFQSKKAMATCWVSVSSLR
jgi:hypothetical protein